MWQVGSAFFQIWSHCLWLKILDGKLVLIGGYNEGSTVKVYDPDTNVLTMKKDISYVDRYSSAV